MKSPANPPHNRKLGLLGVSLVKFRLPKGTEVALGAVRNELESEMIACGFLDGAVFSWVTIAIRFGMQNREQPVFQKVDAKFGDLPLSIEIDSREMLNADLDRLKKIFRNAAILALSGAAEKYSRPVGNLKNEK